MILVKLLKKNVCGEIMYYPDCDTAKLYFKIFRRKALSEENFRAIRKLDCKIEVRE